MATAADIAAFRANCSSLAASGDPDIAMALNVADVFLDATMWDPKDFVLARIFWAAHLLTIQQQQVAAAAAAGGGISVASDMILNSVHFGERSVGFAQRQGLLQFEKSMGSIGAGEGLLATTIYGQLFIQLRDRNIFAVAIV